ncbi:inner membrane-spanning protein YciB [Celeribacter indicus]|uniref:Inner membrane-spanning protein YciB n=1 Tax=Celeribacter indicus TaxID=1208324 RepID=A0A0B5DXP6_9RHOB|nr:inner membrane-spanning protein YciB [Celeribacter indicus]AJE48203.1 intracellular septation protein A [Celeribacter indicus]SDW69350.1 intracellular septation protein [Celeribacter indicus]
MSEKEIRPAVRTALEMGPILAFFAGYILLRDRAFTIGGTEYSGFIVMTAVFIPLIALSTVALWRLTGRLSAMQVMTLVLVTVFGGLTIWLNDERFFKMKPTIIYVMFGAILGVGLWRDRSYLSLVLGETLPLDAAGWRKLEFRMMLFFFGLAVANEAIWRSMSTDAWVQFKTFGLPIAMLAFFMAQAGLMRRHSTDPAETEDAAD